MAYAALGITYGTAREHALAAQFSQRAFDLRDRVSEREKFYISVRDDMDVLDDGERAIEVLELWKQTYPRDFVPRTNLAARYGAIGRYQEALDEAREGVRLNPDAGVVYAAVAHTLIGLGQLGEARAVIEQASARRLDHLTATTCCTRLPSCRAMRRPCSSRSIASREPRPRPGCWRYSRSPRLRRPSAPGEGADETGHRTGEKP